MIYEIFQSSDESSPHTAKYAKQFFSSLISQLTLLRESVEYYQKKEDKLLSGILRNISTILPKMKALDIPPETLELLLKDLIENCLFKNS